MTGIPDDGQLLIDQRGKVVRAVSTGEDDSQQATCRHCVYGSPYHCGDKRPAEVFCLAVYFIETL